MLSCSIWFSAPSFWMGRGLESRCVGRVCGADGAVARHHPHRTHTYTIAVCHGIMWNANLMHQGNFIHIFLARHVSDTYVRHQLGAENHMLQLNV